jgi:hypothetical protein
LAGDQKKNKNGLKSTIRQTSSLPLYSTLVFYTVYMVIKEIKIATRPTARDSDFVRAAADVDSD